MLKSTANLLMMIHAFFGEIGYEASSSNFKSEDVFDYALGTLNHTKDFDNSILLLRMYEFYKEKEEKFIRKLYKYPEFWDSLKYEGKEEIAVLDDDDSVGHYFITNIFNQGYKNILVSSQSFGDTYFVFNHSSGYFSIGDDNDYYLRYSKASSSKMIIKNRKMRNIATIVLSKDAGIFLENNLTQYELEIYDIGIAIFDKNYIYSLGKKEDPDLDKCKGFIQWDIVDKKGNYALSRLEVYDEDADLELMTIFAAACFLVFRSYQKDTGHVSLIGSIFLLSALRKH